MILRAVIYIFLIFDFYTPEAKSQESDDDLPMEIEPESNPPVRKKSGKRAHKGANKFTAMPLESVIKENTVYGFDLGGSLIISRIQDQSVRLNAATVGMFLDHEYLLGLTLVNQATASKHSRSFAVSESRLSYFGIESSHISGWDWIANTRSTLMLGRGTLATESIEGVAKNAAVWVAEPRTGVYFNITPFLRLGFDVSYRFVAVDAKDLRGESWSGYSYGVALRGGLL